MILIVDHYDSFVETLARYVREAGAATDLRRVDALSVSEALALEPEGIILSPGPGRPADTPWTTEIFRAAPHLPILGVCLGHLALAEAYGGTTVSAPTPMHGRASTIRHDGSALFDRVPTPFVAGRYHSLIASFAEDGPAQESAWTVEGALPMAARHETHPHFGVQFHPESLLTPDGRQMIDNFLSIAGRV